MMQGNRGEIKMRNGLWNKTKRVMTGIIAAALLLTAGRALVSSNGQKGIQVCVEEDAIFRHRV